LARHGNGYFEKWYRSLGFKTTKAYEYINHYKFVSSQNEESKIKMFESLPVSLQKQVSKSTATPELVESVLLGDIKTNKEYLKLEKQLKEKDEQIANLSEVITNQEPKVIEKQVEVIPKDYQELKSKVSNADYYKEQNETLKTEVKQLEESYRELLSERSAVDEQSEKYKQLSEAINQAKGQLGESQKLISDYKKLSDLLSKSNEFLSVASSLVYQDLSEVISRDGLAKRELNFLIERLEMFLNDLNRINKNEILEGEIINE
ncbi:hypothetical protein, partial [Vagococcus fluvialis]|uniref:hypothetical protein n=1 Tax=Vagococcus fluvialis TaxID=2738 RepID=UPI003B5A845E